MKKLIVYLSFVVLFVVGCSSDSAKVLKASEKMDELDNFSTKITVESAGVYDGEESEISIVVDGKMDIKNNKNYLTVAMDMGIFDLSIDMYTSEGDGKLITYTQNPLVEDEWTKTIADLDSEESTEEIYENASDMLDIVDQATQFKKVESDLENNDKYELIVANADLKSFIESSSAYLDLDEEESLYDEEGNTIIYVYITNDGYISKMIIDMKDLINVDEETEITKALFTIEFSKFNSSAVTIPANIIENAVLDTEEE